MNSALIFLIAYQIFTPLRTEQNAHRLTALVPAPAFKGGAADDGRAKRLWFEMFDGHGCRLGIVGAIFKVPGELRVESLPLPTSGEIYFLKLHPEPRWFWGRLPRGVGPEKLLADPLPLRFQLGPKSYELIEEGLPSIRRGILASVRNLASGLEGHLSMTRKGDGQDLCKFQSLIELEFEDHDRFLVTVELAKAERVQISRDGVPIFELQAEATRTGGWVTLRALSEKSAIHRVFGPKEEPHWRRQPTFPWGNSRMLDRELPPLLHEGNTNLARIHLSTLQPKVPIEVIMKYWSTPLKIDLTGVQAAESLVQFK